MAESKAKNKKKGKTKSGISLGSKLLVAVWVLFVLGIAGVVSIFVMINNGTIGHLPSVEELQDPKDKYASEIYSADNQVLGRYFQSGENRVFVPYKGISPDLVNALIATEDIRFREHSGIDGKSLLRAIVKTGILQQSEAGGGSTVSQQLAKLLFTEVAKDKWERARQKLSEWVIAVKLEKLYTKDEIISMYFNKFDFLNNAVGIQSASHVYFNTTPDKLQMDQSALLVGMLKNPSRFNPRRFPERCKGRRDVVLSQMVKANYITQQQADSLMQIPVTLNFQKVDHKLGPAPYFREFLRTYMSAEKPDPSKYRGWQRQEFYEDSLAWEVDPLYGWCNKNLKPDGSKYNLYTDGLKIYTTIDSRMQKYAEEAVREYVGGHMQPLFFKEKSGKRYAKRAPFSNKSTQAQVDSIMARAIKNSDRYRKMKGAGLSEAEIKKVFSEPIPMVVFDWAEGSKDTVMSPRDSIRYCKSFLRSGLMSIDPFNGHVKAYVGGIDFKYFQYDMVTTGRRQVGSTIKPFLYALAMERGRTPCDELPNVQPTILIKETGAIWQPRNVPYGDAGKKEVGQMITLRRGLQTSNNWLSAKLIEEFGPDNFVNLLKSFGIKKKMDAVPSLCLGIADISIGEMCAAYTAFANKGIQTEPLYVTRIEDNNGNVIAAFTPRMNEIFSEETAEKMIALLRGVVDGGTGLRIRSCGGSFYYTLPWEKPGADGGKIKHKYCIPWETQMAGKTGTTQNNSDGWFMGFVPNLITGVWVGGEDRDIHFDNLRNGQGSATALPVWGVYMNKVFNDKTLNYSRTEPFNVKDNYNCVKKEVLLDEEAVEGVWE